MASPRGQSRRWNAAAGQAMVIFAMASIPMVLMVGLSVDGANLMMQKRIAQNAADAGAMAGGRGLAKGSTASAINTAVANFATSHTGPFGTTTVASSVFTNSAGTSTGNTSGGSIPSGSVGVSVTTERTVSTYFLTLLNLNSVTVQATARAQTTSTTVAGPSILVLEPTDCAALTISGSGTTNTGTGGAQINSSCSTNALSVEGSADIVTTSPGIVNVVGNCTTAPSATVNGGNCTTNPVNLNEGAAAIADPLASLAVPTFTTPDQGSFTCNNGTHNLSPGVYTQISASGSCTINFAAGNYVVKGGSITMGGTGTFSGTEVFFYLAGANYPSAGGSFGSISLSGGGSSSLTAPTSGTYKNLLIMVERTLAAPITISGNGSLSGVGGSIYAKSSQVTISGNGSSGAQILADKLTISGNGSINITGTSTVWTTTAIGSAELVW